MIFIYLCWWGGRGSIVCFTHMVFLEYYIVLLSDILLQTTRLIPEAAVLSYDHALNYLESFKKY